MALYAIGDLHLSLNSDKSMEVFGPAWELYRADPGVPEPTDGGGCAGAGGRYLLGNEP